MLGSDHRAAQKLRWVVLSCESGLERMAGVRNS